jgi:hypothetical protein
MCLLPIQFNSGDQLRRHLVAGSRDLSQGIPEPSSRLTLVLRPEMIIE